MKLGLWTLFEFENLVCNIQVHLTGHMDASLVYTATHKPHVMYIYACLFREDKALDNAGW